MTTFIPVPGNRYHGAEPEAGEILPALTGRFKRDRPVEQFAPSWSYILTETRPLGCGRRAALRTARRPRAHVAGGRAAVLPGRVAAAHRGGVSFELWYSGRCDTVLRARVAATANTELFGYAVFAVADVPAAVAEVVASLGTVPDFT